MGPAAAGGTFLLRVGISHLPDTDDGVGDQDEQNDKRLHKRRDRVVVVLEEGQNLKSEEKRYERERQHQQLIYRPTYEPSSFLYLSTSFFILFFVLLTNEMMAARSRILTRRSSNCSSTNCHRDFPSSAGSSVNR